MTAPIPPEVPGMVRDDAYWAAIQAQVDAAPTPSREVLARIRRILLYDPVEPFAARAAA